MLHCRDDVHKLIGQILNCTQANFSFMRSENLLFLQMCKLCSMTFNKLQSRFRGAFFIVAFFLPDIHKTQLCEAFKLHLSCKQLLHCIRAADLTSSFRDALGFWWKASFRWSCFCTIFTWLLLMMELMRVATFPEMCAELERVCLHDIVSLGMLSNEPWELPLIIRKCIRLGKWHIPFPPHSLLKYKVPDPQPLPAAACGSPLLQVCMPTSHVCARECVHVYCIDGVNAEKKNSLCGAIQNFF